MNSVSVPPESKMASPLPTAEPMVHQRVQLIKEELNEVLRAHSESREHGLVFSDGICTDEPREVALGDPGANKLRADHILIH